MPPTTEEPGPDSHSPHHVKVERLSSWNEFKNRMAKRYLTYELDVRRKFLFRGHSRASYQLQPTIDRLKRFDDDVTRAEFLNLLVNEFRCSSFGLQSSIQLPTTHEEWEYLGRHHGLPTSILDWTRSPYVAAYFAFEGAFPEEDVSIWALHVENARLDSLVNEVKLDTFGDAVRFNVRSAEQFGESMRVLSAEQPVEVMLRDGLSRLDLPASEKNAALVDLDEMLINRRTLFRDFDGAAVLAAIRLGVR